MRVNSADRRVVSYFEWVQDLQVFFWDEAAINQKLEKVMAAAFNDVIEVRRKKNVDFRTASLILAIERCNEAIMTRGICP